MPVLPANRNGASEMEELYEEESSEASPPEKSEAMPHTDLIDKKLLQGKAVKPGDRIILEVVSVNGDGIEVKYGSDEDTEEEPSEDDQLAQLTT